MVVGPIRLRRRALLKSLQQLPLASHGALGQAEGQVRPGFRIRQGGGAAMVERQGFQHFGRKGGDGPGLPLLLQVVQQGRRQASGVIAVAPLQQVAQGFDAILQAAALLQPPEAKAGGAPAACRAVVRAALAGEAFGAPAVHPGLALLGEHHQ